MDTDADGDGLGDMDTDADGDGLATRAKQNLTLLTP